MLRRGREPSSDGPVNGPAGHDAFAAWAASLPPQWRAPVQDATGSRDRFLALLGQVPAGPTRSWLEGLLPTIDEAVRRVADSVWRAMNAQSMASGLQVERVTEELKAARRDLEVAERAGADSAAARARVDALAERHRAVHDALNVAEDAVGRLHELNVRLDTAVAKATTVVLRATTEATGDLEREFDEVIVGLTALDEALGSFG